MRTDPDVKCPFYSGDESRVIRCEGVEPDSTTQLNFRSCKRKNNYKDTYCRVRWAGCPIAEALTKKWEDDNL